MSKLTISAAFVATTFALLAPAMAQTAQSLNTPPSADTMKSGVNTAAIDPAMLAQGHRASKIVGSAVVNDRDQTIGKIDDLIVGNAGQGAYAVISVGGFLGIDSKLVAVPFSQLRVSGDQKSFTYPGATKDQLKSLPQFKYSGNAI